MTPLRVTRWRRGALVLAAGLLAGAATLPMAAPAMADPVPLPSGGPGQSGSTTVPTPQAGSITWAVQPSSGAAGPDRRTSYIYNDIAPSTIVHDYVAVTNFSKQPVTFQLYASDAFNTPTGTLDLLPAAQKSTNVGAWVTVLHSSLTIPAGARVDEPFTLSVPANATPGDHTGGIIASITVAAPTGNKSLTVDRRLAVPLFLRVSGPLTPTVSIESVSTSYHGTLNPFGGGSAAVAYTIHNTGNVRLNVNQAISVTGLFGTEAKATPTALTDLLPGATYRVSKNLDGILPLGPLTVHVTATPSQVPGLPLAAKAPTPATHDTGLFAGPWSQLILLIILIGLFFGVRWYLGSRRKRTAALVATAVENTRRQTTDELTGAAAGSGDADTTG
jgi:hypothetical protein